MGNKIYRLCFLSIREITKETGEKVSYIFGMGETDSFRTFEKAKEYLEKNTENIEDIFNCVQIKKYTGENQEIRAEYKRNKQNFKQEKEIKLWERKTITR